MGFSDTELEFAVTFYLNHTKACAYFFVFGLLLCVILRLYSVQADPHVTIMHYKKLHMQYI